MLERIKQLLGLKKKSEPKFNTAEENLATFNEYIPIFAKLLGDTSLLESTPKDQLAQAMIAPLMPNWRPAPEGTTCVVCKSADVERSNILVGGPFSGSVRCKACGWVESVMSNIARNCIIIEPLGPGAMPVYGDEAAFKEVADTDLFAALNTADINELLTKIAVLEVREKVFRKFIDEFAAYRCSCEYAMARGCSSTPDSPGHYEQGPCTKQCIGCKAREVLQVAVG